MALSDRRKAHGGLFIVCALGTGLLALHIAHAVSEGENLWTYFLGILIPMGFSIGILAGGSWLWGRDLDGSHVLRIGVWCLVGGGVLALGAVLLILYQESKDVILSDRLFVMVNAVSGGSVVGFVVGVYDMRQRVAREQAEQLSRQFTVLNRVLRHDIRNSANIIQGHAELLLDRNGDNVKVETIRERATELVEMGDQARTIEQFFHDDSRTPIDIGSLLEEQLERLRRDYATVDVQSSVPAGQRVCAHPLIASAIANVLDNAVEHNDKQSPRIRIDSRRVRRSGAEFVEIRIADNGPGIPPDQIEVLERGYETPLEHMSGLGLWLVNWIVTESDGVVWFEENSPEGSTVAVQLEAVESAQQEKAGAARG